MSFLKDTIVGAAPTKEQQLQNTVRQIKTLSKQAFEQLVTTQNRGIKLVWEHPNLTPQEVIDELGETAIRVFQFHGGLTDYLETLATIESIDIDLKYPTNAFTIDALGKITVTDQPYVK